MYGADPGLNSALAAVIAAAKKSGMPKDRIDVAVARGQGRSSTGAKLEHATLELMLSLPPQPQASPPVAALVVDVETDNKARALMDLRVVAKKSEGCVVTPTAFLFDRLGRIVLEPKKKETKEWAASGSNYNNDGSSSSEGDAVDDEVLMTALDHGAEDVYPGDEPGTVVITTQPQKTHQVAQDVSVALGMDVLSADIGYSPNAEKVRVNGDDVASRLVSFLEELREVPDVTAVYANVERGDAVEDAVWDKVEENLAIF
jgi:transcriptional/translational regulatory protein YebC/TACO1